MKEEDYIKLILRNLKGELSPSEFDMLNIETAKSPVLAELRIEIEDTWDISGANDNIVTPSETKALFTKIKKTQIPQKDIEGPIKQNTSKIFTLQRIISGIAALLALVFGSIWLMQDKNNFYDKPGHYTLADNSEVNLREGSTLTVNPFTDDSRNVVLTGEAFFDVSKDTNRPFTINTSKVKIEVLGTSFLVKEHGADTYIDLIEGKISTTDIKTNQKETLTAGMQAHHNADGKIDIKKGKSNLSGWKDGYFRFSDVRLGDVLSELALIFNTEITLENLDLKECNFSGNLAGDSINDLLSRIAKIHNMEVKQDGSKWILSGGTCN